MPKSSIEKRMPDFLRVCILDIVRSRFRIIKVDQARRLKELEQENTRLKRAVADLTLDKLIRKEAAEGNW